MADKNTNQNHEEVQELLKLLDRMQNRPHVPEVEDVLIQSGRPDLARTDPYTPPTVTDGFDPDLPVTDLSELLITPDDPQEDEEHKEAAHLAQFLLQEEEKEEKEAEQPLPPAPDRKENPFKVLGGLLTRLWPSKKDDKTARYTKVGVLTALVAVLAVIALLVTELYALPLHNRRYNEKLAAWYQRDSGSALTDTTLYPWGMRPAFKKLYQVNDDVMGWLSFHSTDGSELIDIEYPVVQAEDNTTYQNHDFHGRYNRNGTLYFDTDSHIEYGDTGRVLTVYGNTVGSGQMLSGLNRLLNSEAYARTAASFTLSTLYEESEYYVFAVFLLDEDETVPQHTIELRSRFLTAQMFLEYTQELRARSLFDYPTDMVDTDQVVFLTTELTPTGSVLDNGRIVVAARRRRPGEQAMNTAAITQNVDVIMPYRWYTEQGLAVHDYYAQWGEDGSEATTTTGNSTYNNPFATETTVTDLFSTTTTVTPVTTTTTVMPVTTTTTDASVVAPTADGTTTTTVPIDTTTTMDTTTTTAETTTTTTTTAEETTTTTEETTAVEETTSTADTTTGTTTEVTDAIG